MGCGINQLQICPSLEVLLKRIFGFLFYLTLTIYIQLLLIVTFNIEQFQQQTSMFNPKQALQRLRRNKNDKKQTNPESKVQPLFPEKIEAQQGSQLEGRVSKLEEMITRLTEELTNSNEAISKLKKQNSNLQTQVLKLQYENSQLKSQQVYSELRRQGSSSRLPQTIRQQTKQGQKSYEKPKIKADPLNVFHPQQIEKPTFSYQVQDFVAQIKNQPIENILRRKQNQFRARKPQKRGGMNSQGQPINKYLKDLGTIQKNYSRCLTNKPILVIKLDDADFQ